MHLSIFPLLIRLIWFAVKQNLLRKINYKTVKQKEMIYCTLTDEENFSISGSQDSLEWRVRFKVAVGVAEGLHYLHHACHRRIIHRDIKASNILLTEDYEPQVLLKNENSRDPENGLCFGELDCFTIG